MAVQIVYRDEGAVGSPCVCQARLIAPDATGTSVTYEGNAVQAADVSTITCNVYDVSAPNPSAIVASPAITTAAFSALTADNQWARQRQPIDSIGRNFLFTVPGTAFKVPAHTYWIVFQTTLTGGSLLTAIFEHLTSPVAP